MKDNTVLIIADVNGRVVVDQLWEATPEQALETFKRRRPEFEIASVTETTHSALPERTFRGAWRPCPEQGIRHCMDTARDIQRGFIRDRRKDRFKETDIAIALAVANNRDTSAINDMVQGLRDAPRHPVIDAAQTVEDLKAAWPDVLEQPVPPLGDVRIAGEAATYDTKALEEWGKSITDRINQAATMRDLQEVLSKLDAKLESANDLAARLERLEVVVPEIARAADFILKEARGPAELTQEELT